MRGKISIKLGLGLMSAIMLMAVIFGDEAHAKTDSSFSYQYGLVVHNINKNSEVPRIKALKVLLKYFPDAKTSTKNKSGIRFRDIKDPDKKSIERACDLELMDCSKIFFGPLKNISQADFLDWFLKLKYAGKPDYLKKKYPDLTNPFFYNWLEVKNLNLGTENKITYSVMNDFLLKNKISENNFNRPYVDGMVLEDSYINSDNFHNLKEIEHIEISLKEAISGYDNKKISKNDSVYLKTLKSTLKNYQTLHDSLKKSPYVLEKYPDISPEVTKGIREYGLQDILFSYTYDYSKNASYRKYNLITGVSKMNGKVFMPGDVIDYWKILSDKGLADFTNGWSIVKGEEVWEFGGGICGSATSVFVPSWLSGLEVVERKNHSIFYKNLYPSEYIGLDSTIYRPKPNLKIKNNTGSPIIFEVSNDKAQEVITVRIIGNNPYKKLTINGPIFLNKRSVKWVRQTEDYDGKITTDELESRYNAIY